MTTSKKHISKAHDHFFRMAMSDQRVARDFFQAHLPQDLQALTNLDYLELQSGSYIDEMRQESIADMLFKTRIDEHESYLYLIVDHQSRPDEFMPFRVLKYVCNIIDQHLKNTQGAKKVPLILPLVVYHGKQPWLYSTDINDLVDAPSHLIAAYFLKPFILIDLNHIEDAVLKKNTWAGIMELALKHIFANDMLSCVQEIVELLRNLAQFDAAGSENLAEIVLTYILDRGELRNKKAFFDLIKTELSPDIGEKIMTIAEQIRAEGVQQGMQQGTQQGVEQGKIEIAKRLLEKNMALPTIEEITGLSLVKIQEIQKNH